MRTQSAFATLVAAAALAGCATATPIAAPDQQAAAAAPQIETLNAPDLSHTKGAKEPALYTVYTASAGKKTTVKWTPVKKTKVASSSQVTGNGNPIPTPACGDHVLVHASMPVPAIPAIISPTTGPYGSASGGGQVPGGYSPFGLPPMVSTVTIDLDARQTIAYTNFYGGPITGNIPFDPTGAPPNTLPGIPGVAGSPLSGLSGTNATGWLTIKDNVGDTLRGRVTTIMANPDGGAAGGRNMVATVSGVLDNGEQFVVTVQDTNATNGISGFHGALVSFSGSILVGGTPAMGMTAFDVPYIFTAFMPLSTSTVEVELGQLCTSFNPFGVAPYTHI